MKEDDWYKKFKLKITKAKNADRVHRLLKQHEPEKLKLPKGQC